MDSNLRKMAEKVIKSEIGRGNRVCASAEAPFWHILPSNMVAHAPKSSPISGSTTFPTYFCLTFPSASRVPCCCSFCTENFIPLNWEIYLERNVGCTWHLPICKNLMCEMRGVLTMLTHNTFVMKETILGKKNVN